MDAVEVNSFFYRYFQMAYEYVNQQSEDSVQGSPIYYHLLRKRIESVFEDSGQLDDGDQENDWRLEDFQNWFLSRHKAIYPRIIEGNIGDFQFKDERINESIDAELDKYFSETDYSYTTDGGWSDLGMDYYATYLPMHFFYDGDRFSRNWGIYISEDGVLRIASFLYNATKTWPRKKDVKNFKTHLVEIAFEILLRHELEHFKVESFALNMEIILHKPVYTPYIMRVYATKYPNLECLEEAAANSTVLCSTRINNLFLKIFNEINKLDWTKLLKDQLFSLQPACYGNTDFVGGWSSDVDPFKDEMVSYSSGKTQQLGTRTRAMNYLCNQILATASPETNPFEDGFPRNIPFFAFMPDNYFLRAENLVPIHLVQCLNPDDCMIGLTVPKKNQFLQFIKAFGFIYIRTNDHLTYQSEHFQDNLTLRFHKHGELDFNAFKSSIKTLGISYQEYMRYFQLSNEEQKAFVDKQISARPKRNLPSNYHQTHFL